MEVVIRPVTLLAKIVGLQGPKSKIHHCRIGFSLILLTFAVVTRQILVPVDSKKGFIIAAVEFANYNFRLPTIFCCLVMTNKNGMKDYVLSISLLDKKLESMGFPVDYKEIKQAARILTITLIFKIILQQISFCLQILSWQTINYLDYIVHNIPIVIIHVLLTQWIVYLTILRNHFKILNTILKTVRYGQCWKVEDFHLSKKMTRQRDLFRECASIYDTLFLQSEKINSCFSPQFLFLIPTLFILIIFSSFQTCRMVKNLIEFDCFWIIFDVLYFVIFLELVTPCLSVQKQSEKFVDSLHKMSDNGVDDAINSLILQSYHQKIKFSACGVFPLDGTLIYTVLGALTTYLVILLQFDL